MTGRSGAVTARLVHAVGPVWQGGGAGEAALLESAYRCSLELARREGLATIAFPAISTGIYGYPLAPATGIAVRTVMDELTRGGSGMAVTFACFGADVLNAYAAEGVATSPPGLA